MKRLIIATLGGIVCGFICLGLASSGGSLAWPIILQIVSSRTLIGVAIGLSCLTLGHWTVHGLVLGLIFSMPLAFSGLLAPGNPQFSKEMMFLSTVIMGMIYGVLIELVTSGLFKAKVRN
jgi:hypothetical protein